MEDGQRLRLELSEEVSDDFRSALLLRLGTSTSFLVDSKSTNGVADVLSVLPGVTVEASVVTVASSARFNRTAMTLGAAFFKNFLVCWNIRLGVEKEDGVVGVVSFRMGLETFFSVMGLLAWVELDISRFGFLGSLSSVPSSKDSLGMEPRGLKALEEDRLGVQKEGKVSLDSTGDATIDFN